MLIVYGYLYIFFLTEFFERGGRIRKSDNAGCRQRGVRIAHLHRPRRPNLHSDDRHIHRPCRTPCCLPAGSKCTCHIHTYLQNTQGKHTHQETHGLRKTSQENKHLIRPRPPGSISSLCLLTIQEIPFPTSLSLSWGSSINAKEIELELKWQFLAHRWLPFSTFHVLFHSCLKTDFNDETPWIFHIPLMRRPFNITESILFILTQFELIWSLKNIFNLGLSAT